MMRRWATVVGAGLLIGIGAGLWTTHALWGYWLTRPSVVEDAAELGDPEWSSSFAAGLEDDFIHIRSASEHKEWARLELLPCDQWLSSSCLDGRALKSFPTPTHREVAPELVVRLLGALGFSGSCGRLDVPAERCWQVGTLVRIARDGKHWFVVSVSSGEINDDTRWFVEAILREATDGQIEVVRRVSFRFDTSGIEGFDWRIVTPVVSLLAMGIIALVLRVPSPLSRKRGSELSSS